MQRTEIRPLQAHWSLQDPLSWFLVPILMVSLNSHIPPRLPFPFPAGLFKLSLMFYCGTLHVISSVAAWSLSFIDENSAPLLSQNTLQAGRTAGQTYCGLDGVSMSPLQDLPGRKRWLSGSFPLIPRSLC